MRNLASLRNRKSERKKEKPNELFNGQKSTKTQHRIKIIATLCLTKGRCCFVTSDFPSENPRTQNRNYSYTNTLYNIENRG